VGKDEKKEQEREHPVQIYPILADSTKKRGSAQFSRKLPKQDPGKDDQDEVDKRQYVRPEVDLIFFHGFILLSW
jgi:hypothetical protein